MTRAATRAHSPSTSVITWIGYDAPQSVIVGVPDAGGLHLTGVDPNQNGSHIHSTTAEHDIIRLADGSFGPNPSDPEFGGR
jgi:hypothetical protein